jgi:hypothetical protein
LYTVFVHDYPQREFPAANPVTVKIYLDGAHVLTLTEVISGEDQEWYVCTIDWPSGVVTPL